MWEEVLQSPEKPPSCRMSKDGKPSMIWWKEVIAAKCTLMELRDNPVIFNSKILSSITDNREDVGERCLMLHQ